MSTLEGLVAKLPKGGKLIFLGDMSDRGEYSKEMVEFVGESGSLAILGNHEYMIKGKYSSVDGKLWREYGGAATLASYEDVGLMKEHEAHLKGLPLYLEIEDRFITHGFELPFYRRRKEQPLDLLCNRLEELFSLGEGVWEYGVFNIFGHTPYERVLIGSNYAGIDTGAVFGGRLSALNIETLEVVDVALDRRDEWHDMS
ncbi:MAG: hypothetical protein C6I00_02960 [Nitratiruptor sp.]|nr:hypothetical protein [Nitratiruptor sp.]NPA82909.1 hypothetical protein [Campylobacterota bacterium]